MTKPCYILVTPARNEESTIELTIKSVLRQSILPEEWIIVSDESTDDTDEIVKHYAKKNAFMRLVRIKNRPKRSFSSVVFATEMGIKSIQQTGYEYIGLLDADVRFGPDYYETLIERFQDEPMLGLAGGLVVDIVDGERQHGRQYKRDVAGATQFFRRECLDSIGNLVPVPEGGWDAITCFKARAKGYITQTFPDLIVDHLKPRNVAEGNIIRRQWQNGQRDYALAGHPIFEVLKCASRFLESPFIVGVAARFAGYSWCLLRKKKRTIAPEIAELIQNEQLSRILPRFIMDTIRAR